MEVHPDIARLAALIDEMAALCTKYENRWATQLWTWREALLQSDAWGLHGFLQSFGGMGSLNDVVLDDDAHDNRFQALKEDAWQLAHQLKRTATGV